MGKKMGKYCKAYYLSDFREFPRWPEKLDYMKKEKDTADSKEVERERPLTERDILYLQENYVVTDGIFLEEHVIFDAITPEWIDFCKKKLSFEVPVYEHSRAHDESGT
jgi:hypothetical protein